MICRRLFAPPSKPVLFNFGPFERKWSWALLPSPLPDRPFAWCSVKDFALALAEANGAPAMRHPAWCSGTWFVLRSLPLAKVASLIWKIGTNNMFLPPLPKANLVCKACQVPATIEHIVFACAHTQPLWSEFCKHTRPRPFSHSSGVFWRPEPAAPDKLRLSCARVLPVGLCAHPLRMVRMVGSLP